MKYFILTLIFNLLANTCTKNKICELTLQSASWYNWFGGIPNVGGTDYTFKFSNHKCEDIQIDSVFIDGQSFKFKVNRIKNICEIMVSKKIKYMSDNGNHKMSKSTINRPSQPPNVARIVYYSQNRSSEIIIDRFIKRQDKFYH